MAFPSRSLTKTTRVLERMHMNVTRLLRALSNGGAMYVLTLVDEFSRYLVTYFIKNKSDVASKLEEFKAFYQNQCEERLKRLLSDNGTEFVNKNVADICQRNGIVHQRSLPYNFQQNGVAKQMNRTTMEKARSILYYNSVRTEWWAEAVSTAVYLISRSANVAHPDITPGLKVKPRMEHLRVFGSQGYAHVDDAKRVKQEPKSFRCMFLGYVENVKGYRVFDLERSKVKVSRSGKLDECGSGQHI
ncbi:hypothetical protein PI125_g5246 [Phytophthora idaei]|nr:hypothetical protein PI125_g5246 [Phytophthora idaei]KAG3164608.1 hypothetical protein PI126_g5044 [Phytophthora idaei]